jgi:hypothetical protein
MPVTVEEEENAAFLPANGQVAVVVDRMLQAELIENLLDKGDTRQDRGATIRVAWPGCE